MGTDYENILQRLVRIGTVTDVKKNKHLARVKFENEEDTSGWLYVIQRPGAGVKVTPDGKHDHVTVTDGGHSHVNAGGSGPHSHNISEVPDHDHDGTTTTWWVPKINDTVLVLYLPIYDSDGFILGVI